MLYYDTKLAQAFTESGLRQRGLPITRDVLAQAGIYPLDCDVPAHNPTTHTAEPTVIVDAGNGRYRQEFALVPRPLTEWMVVEKLERINAGKNAALDSGFMLDGVLYDSDSKARLAYLELSLKLGQDPAYSTPWKASTGVWVTMDAALFEALQPAYEAHIQSCFAWQAAREQEVAAAVEAGDVEALAGVAEKM